MNRARNDVDILIKQRCSDGDRIDALKKENGKLSTQVASHDKVLGDCRDRINDLIGRNDTLREKLAARDKEFESLRVLSSRVVKERDECDQENTELARRNSELHSRISELTSVKIVFENGTIRSGNTEWKITSSKPGCPIGPECGPGRTCPCFPVAV